MPSSPGRPSTAAIAAADATIFRAEALDSHSGGSQRPDAVIRLGEPWLRWLYGLALGLVALGVVLALTAKSAEESDGTAVVTEPGGQFAALLPVAAAADLAHGGVLAVVLTGSRSQPVTITAARAQLADATVARRAGLPQPDQPSILVTGRLAPGGLAPGLTRHGAMPAALILRPERVATIVADEFQVMLGTREAGS
jgi:hypothetical protein